MATKALSMLSWWNTPIDQLHLYVWILFGGRSKGSSQILGLWSQAVYALYVPAQLLRRNHKVIHLTLGIWIR